MINRESQVSAAPPDLTDLVYRELWAVKHRAKSLHSATLFFTHSKATNNTVHLTSAKA